MTGRSNPRRPVDALTRIFVRLRSRVAARATANRAWLRWLLVFAVLLLPGRHPTEEFLVPETSRVIATEWGGEAVGVVQEYALSWSPISIANACGLGTSSCVRCHDGKRAAQPASDSQAAPWHHDHAKVDYSCVGCHQGNPRILKQELAHRKLVAHPLAEEGAPACAGCHATGDVDRRIAGYLHITPPSPSN